MIYTHEHADSYACVIWVYSAMHTISSREIFTVVCILIFRFCFCLCDCFFSPRLSIVDCELWCCWSVGFYGFLMMWSVTSIFFFSLFTSHAHLSLWCFCVRFCAYILWIFLFSFFFKCLCFKSLMAQYGAQIKHHQTSKYKIINKEMSNYREMEETKIVRIQYTRMQTHTYIYKKNMMNGNIFNGK